MTSSITTKLLAILLTVFALVLSVSTAYQYLQQRDLINSVLSEQLHDKASNYFDSLNMMMLTGTMAQKETLRQKALAQDGIEQVRVLRGDPVRKLFGDGEAYQSPQDDIDRRVLQGEMIIEPYKADWGTGLVVALPMKASENYRGTNCVACHMAPEGEVLGAIRLEYNLSHINSLISQRTMIAVAIMAAIAFIGFAITMTLTRKMFVRPVQKTSRFMQQVSSSKNLALRLGSERRDEVGQLANAIDSFLDTVSDSLHDVQETSHALASASTQLTKVAQATDNAANNQQRDTQSVQANIEQMQLQQQQVDSATINASDLIKHTSIVVETSAASAHSASVDIKGLVGDIESVKQRMADLNTQTGEVSNILQVIKGIADQTNLLALNAAIEAARAGEQGRGFAVVADEVRQLASRTADATGSIDSIISQFQSDSEASMESVDAVCNSAHQRSTDIESLSVAMTEVVTEMQQALNRAESIQQQSQQMTAINSEVSEKVEVITQHANETSTSAAQSRQISENLQSLSDRLETLLNQFSLLNR
ncbi:methyl-accepting chemotaxis protein [Vibrio sp.]|uniref:methyl-accepting chemotaxis protein n=1 Tax=Vibrio sp. TaxID=678 RepID=UPI003D0CBAA0